MINILEILKKIPNLEDMVFYSPLYGNVRVTINDTDLEYPIQLYEITGNYVVGKLTKYGKFLIGKDACTECMLYPSRQNRDWSTFKMIRKDLPEYTSVIVSDGTKLNWVLRKYKYNSKCYSNSSHLCLTKWEYIIPVDKFNFNDWSFKEEDNYGTKYKE